MHVSLQVSLDHRQISAAYSGGVDKYLLSKKGTSSLPDMCNPNICNLFEGVASCVFLLNRKCSSPIEAGSGNSDDVAKDLGRQLFEIQKMKIPAFCFAGLARLGGSGPFSTPQHEFRDDVFEDGEAGGYSIYACTVWKPVAFVGYDGQDVPTENVSALLGRWPEGTERLDDRKRQGDPDSGTHSSAEVSFKLFGGSDNRGVFFALDEWVSFGDGVPSDVWHTVPSSYEISASGRLPSTKLMMVRDLLEREALSSFSLLHGGKTPIVGRCMSACLMKPGTVLP